MYSLLACIHCWYVFIVGCTIGVEPLGFVLIRRLRDDDIRNPLLSLYESGLTGPYTELFGLSPTKTSFSAPFMKFPG
jgi:hypothetical protein